MMYFWTFIASMCLYVRTRIIIVKDEDAGSLEPVDYTSDKPYPRFQSTQLLITSEQ